MQVIRKLKMAFAIGFFLGLCGCVPYGPQSHSHVRQVVKIQRPIPKLIEQVPAGRWLLINGSLRTLTVMEKTFPRQVFSGISFGGGGVGHKTRMGDMITPIGRYAIGWVNRSSKFELFFGITYPNAKDAERGLAQGLISPAEARYIQYLSKMRNIPPQNTRLGGMIGIHGVGMGDVALHRVLNWTDGCIALDNDQIYNLSSWISEGMVVEIKP